MRKDFAAWVEKYGKANPQFIFMTGDLGFQALENVQAALGDRFVNMGVAEQNMVSVGAGMAQQGLSVVCYSIAPFAVFRPCEQIRLDVALHDKDVKIVGNGGGYGYGIMGATHHAIDDIAMLSAFQNMVCFVPFCNEDVAAISDRMMARKGPAYLRLGFGVKPPALEIGAYAPVRQLFQGERATVVCSGPVTLNALEAIQASQTSVDVFCVSEFPLRSLGNALTESVRKTRKVLIVEEHVRRGGLGEMVALMLMQDGIAAKLSHLCAQGYPGHRYGSQKYHQTLSNLDAPGITQALAALIADPA